MKKKFYAGRKIISWTRSGGSDKYYLTEANAKEKENNILRLVDDFSQSLVIGENVLQNKADLDVNFGQIAEIIQ